MGIAASIMLIIYLATLRPYRAHYQMMQQLGDSHQHTEPRP
jgi:hypothetical protein